jgi:hypothetical protein
MKRFLSVLFVLLAVPVYAQNANQTQLRLVVVDETGAGIPNATIIVTPANGNAVTFTSDERGLASSPNLPSGTAKLHVEFEGFQPFEEPINLRRGAMNQTVTLKIAGVQEEVVVNDTTALDDRRGNSQSTTLEEAEIEELPEDPEELAEVLAAMAGGSGAVFQVNGFRGGRLPSRDEIRQIRFRTNSFSADNHDAGRTQIEIITRPNVRAWNGNGSFNYRGDAMNARNAFATVKTPEQNRNFNLGARGPIVKGKTSIRLGLDGRRDYQADTIVAVDENGNRLGDYVRRPSESTNATIGLEHALTNNQTLRFEYRRGENTVENNGVGGFNLPERAFNTHRRARYLYEGRRRRLEPWLEPDLRVSRESRFQHRAQAADARRLHRRGGTLQELRRAQRRWYVHLRVARYLQREPARDVYPASRPGGHLVHAVQRGLLLVRRCPFEQQVLVRDRRAE